jgi:hypothetical protein
LGDICVVGGHATLIEHFHTRSMLAPVTEERSIAIWTWIPREMRDLVIVGDRDFVATRDPSVTSQTFDLDAPGTRHALCFRPSSMHLRTAKLPTTFDRVVGDRAGRVDVARDATV